MNADQLMPKFADVLAAQERIRGKALQTPVLSDTALDQVAQAKVFLKCENLQRAGAFKIPRRMEHYGATHARRTIARGRGLFIR